MRRFFILYILPVIALMAILSSCGDNDEPMPVKPETPTGPDKPVGPDPDDADKTPLTLLIYMVADNSLGTLGFAEQDLSEISTAMSENALGENARLLVYKSMPGVNKGVVPELVEFTDGAPEPKLLKSYPDDPSIYSTSEERMAEVLEDVREIAPAKEYGLIMWSHSTAWRTEDSALPARSFGQDRDRRMAIPALSRVLNKFSHKFIYFDCCLMANIEVAYELRHATPLIVASGAEVHGDGMPYQLTVPIFAKGDVRAVAEKTFEYYDSRSGVDRWCTQSVIETDKLDRLAAATRSLMETATPLSSIRGIQTYTPTSSFRTYDMDDYVCRISADETAYQAWLTILTEAVTYKASTPYVNGNHRIAKYCGLSSNIVTSANDASKYHYNELQWWADVVSHNPNFAE